MRQKSFVSLCRGGCVAAALLGVGLLQATTAFAGMGRLTLSADGPTAADGRDIYSINPILPLAHKTQPAMQAVVSPDGKKILFTKEVFDEELERMPAGYCDLYVVGSDGLAESLVKRDVQCDSLAWSPSGDRIIWASSNLDPMGGLIPSKIVSAKLDGSDEQVIADASSKALVYSPAYSPDGNKVIFVHRFYDSGTTSLTWSLVTVDSRGGSKNVIYSTSDVILSPTWSPDGKRVAFENDNFGPGSVIALVDKDGSGYSEFTSSAKSSSSPIWSKDGRSLIYVEEGSVSPFRSVLIRGLDGSPAQPINQRVPYPSFESIGGYSSDGTIAVTLGYRQLGLLYTDEQPEGFVTRDGNDQDQPSRVPGSDRVVYRDENGARGFGSDLVNSRTFTSSGSSLDLRRLFDTDALESDPAVSPDGKRVVFVRTTVFPFESGIYTADAQTGLNEQLVVKGDVSVSDPSWSPDGSKIVYSVDNPFSGWDVYKVNADGSGGEVALTNVRGSESSPVWSPVNNRVLFVAAGNIYSIEADGTDRKLLTSTPTVAENNLSVSTDGQWILYDGGNGKVYAMRPDGSRQTVLVDGLPGASHPTW